MYLPKSSQIVSSLYLFSVSQCKIIFLNMSQANRMSDWRVITFQLNQRSFWIADKIWVFQIFKLKKALHKLDIVKFHHLTNTWEWVKHLIFTQTRNGMKIQIWADAVHYQYLPLFLSLNCVCCRMIHLKWGTEIVFDEFWPYPQKRKNNTELQLPHSQCLQSGRTFQMCCIQIQSMSIQPLHCLSCSVVWTCFLVPFVSQLDC